MRFVPRWGRLAVWVVAAALTTACSGSISSDDVDRATARWEERAPPIYHWRADGEIDGRGVDLDTYAVNGVVESPVLGAADFGIDALFGEIRGAIDAGVAVTASFDDDLGYPQEVEIDGRLSLTTRDFIPLERPEPCPSTPGSARDLDAEHTSWLMAGFERWFDVDGCPIRLDVIGSSRVRSTAASRRRPSSRWGRRSARHMKVPVRRRRAPSSGIRTAWSRAWSDARRSSSETCHRAPRTPATARPTPNSGVTAPIPVSCTGSATASPTSSCSTTRSTSGACSGSSVG